MFLENYFVQEPTHNSKTKNTIIFYKNTQFQWSQQNLKNISLKFKVKEG